MTGCCCTAPGSPEHGISPSQAWLPTVDSWEKADIRSKEFHDFVRATVPGGGGNVLIIPERSGCNVSHTSSVLVLLGCVVAGLIGKS